MVFVKVKAVTQTKYVIAGDVIAQEMLVDRR